MIKSDVIKRQLELNRIIEEQERVKQELKRQEEENKEKEDKSAAAFWLILNRRSGCGAFI